MLPLPASWPWCRGRAACAVQITEADAVDFEIDNVTNVVTRDGLPLGYEVFAGNRADATTVEDMVQAMKAKYGRAACR